jgi:exopolysaccharide production protein ExoQ
MLFVFGILALFIRDWAQRSRTSLALWIPMFWFLIIATRPVSMWLNIAPEASPDQVLDGSPVDRGVFALLLVAGVAVLVGRIPRVKQVLRGNWAVLLYFGYCCISITWSDYPFVAWKRWIKLVGDLVMVLLVLTDANPKTAFRRFLSWPTFLLIPLSVLFIKYYPSLGRSYARWTFEPIIVGITYNKNLLGVICLIWGLGLVWVFREELRLRTLTSQSLLINSALLVMMVWLLKMAHSATSLSCFAMGVVLIIWTSIPIVARRPTLTHLAAGAMTCTSFAVLFAGMGTEALDALGKDPTLTGRTELWGRLFKMTDNPILGTGFESFWLGPRLEALWKIYWWKPNQAHNGYIEVFINLGWIGVALLALMIFVAYRRAILAVQRGESDGSLRLAYVVIAVIYNFTEASFRMQNLMWIIILFAIIGTPAFGEQRAGISRKLKKVKLVRLAGNRPKRAAVVGAGIPRR